MHIKNPYKLAFGVLLLIFLLAIVSVAGYLYFVYYNQTEPVDQSKINLTDNLKSSVVNVICPTYKGDFDFGGSGVMWDESGIVLTNYHVIPKDDNGSGCMVIIPETESGTPQDIYWAYPIVMEELSESYDLAYLKIYRVYTDADDYFPEEWDDFGEYPRFFNTPDESDWCFIDELNLGDPVVVLGYPSLSGGETLTLTDGIISGFTGDDKIMTSAQVTSGNSGGLAISNGNCLIGITYGSFIEDTDSLGGIISFDLIYDFAIRFEIGDYKAITPEWAKEL